MKGGSELKGFVLGIFLTLAAALTGAYLFVTGGALPVGQDVKPGKFERWIAKASLRTAIGRQTRGVTDPLPPTAENLAAGITLYNSHCRTCHGGPDGVASVTAKGLTPYPPQLARHGVEDDPEATTHWKITHGIRFTGMPAYGQTLSDGEIWQVTLFLKHMNSLPSGPREDWTSSKSDP